MPRGRKPAHLNVVPIPVIPGQGRPQAPENLPPEEVKIWQEVVGSMPAGWFASSFHLLRLLCCHAATARVVSAELAKLRAKRDWIGVKRLTPLYERETRSVAYLSSVLRITPRSRTSTEWAANHTQNPQPSVRPWEVTHKD